MNKKPALIVVMYHYIRDFSNTSFPRLNGMLLGDFERQIAALKSRYEMATIESVFEYLRGTYNPTRDVYLLTFDDGFKEHYEEVTPRLAALGIQGIFFPITSCMTGQRVAPVHMNHFLKAAIGFDRYRNQFMGVLNDMAASRVSKLDHNQVSTAQRTYRWDAEEVARFKYLLNFVLDFELRNKVLKALFETHVADEKSFSSTLYFDMEEARQMQSTGMVIGGHSHLHKPLTRLSEEELCIDLSSSWNLLREHLHPQLFWPFSYPYGKRASFNAASIKQLMSLGFNCAFTTEVGANYPGTNLFALRRLDCKEVIYERDNANYGF